MAVTLWLLLFGLALGVVLHRWYDPVPLRCWALWGALVALLFGPLLWRGDVLFPVGPLTQGPPLRAAWAAQDAAASFSGSAIQMDLVTQIGPWLDRSRDRLRHGEWPLWNAGSGAGEPLLGNPQSQALQPLVWLTLPLDAPDAVNAIAAMRLVVPLVFFFLLLRRQGLGEAAALLGSFSFALAGYLQGWLGWPLAGSATFLPALLYAVVLVDERGARRDTLLCAAAGLAVLLVGHPETTLYVFTLAAAFALARARNRGWAGRRTAARAWLGAALVAAGLAAPALLPALRYLPQTSRAAALAERHVRLAGSDPLSGWRTAPERAASRRAMAARLAPIFAPNAQGSDHFGRYWGEQNVIHDAAIFTGSAALLAAILALLPSPGRRWPQERLVAGIAIVCLAVVARPPGLAHLFDLLPVLRDSSSLHSRLSLGVNFAVAYLAACSWERWARRDIERRAVLVAFLLLVACVVWATLSHPDPRNPASLRALRFGSLAVHLAVLLGSAALLARRPPAEARVWKRSTPTLILLALVVAELVFVFRPAWPSGPARLFYPETADIASLRERLAPGERIAALGTILRPNVASVYGLADARTSNPARPAAIARLWWQAEGSRAADRPGGAVADRLEGIGDPARDRLLDRLGVRFLLVPERIALPPPARRVDQRGTLKVYRRPTAFPLVFLAETTAQPNVVSRRDPVADAGPGDPGLRLERAEATRVTARVVPGGPLAEPRRLASGIYQDGGWRVLSGPVRSASTDRGGSGPGQGTGRDAEEPFVAGWLPAGVEVVELVYRPPGFLAGMLLAAAALAGVAPLLAAKRKA